MSEFGFDESTPDSGAAAQVQPLLVLTTGGTIDKVYFDASSKFEVGESVIPELLKDAHVDHPYQLYSLMRKDSLELTDADREEIFMAVQASQQKQVVITHGTDTMTDTARVLADLDDHTVVLTGSLSPARFARTDATFNIGMAFAAAQTLPAGVYIVMNGRVFHGLSVRKDRDKNRFVPC